MQPQENHPWCYGFCVRALDGHASPRTSPLIKLGSVCGDSLRATPGESSLEFL